MRNTVLIAQMLVRITGLLQIVLGLLIWTGIVASSSLVLTHMVSGLVFVISMWVLVFAAFRARKNPTLAGVTLIYGVLVIALGLVQTTLLPGPAHWVIRVVHLLVGMGAIGLAERLARAILVSQENRTTVQSRA